ncbi:VOC family protein [Brevundimonas sp. PAMC22021]|uniref:VOC family protein n=1 Tax=Brevundimonas sp. PAMC22021 TaxID=2861285 RepID=UPI001C6265BA|nr:VOC family protein [Brevundimonas sp. PAMC22021]QYF86318.1 VOC family protein [Brevundimonas sp. PAMC22021]
MSIAKVYANLSCRDLNTSTRWFTALFGRDPDTAPMAGLHEWDCGSGGLQLYEKPEHAGAGTLTLIVDDIAAERARLDAAGLVVAEVEAADYTTIMRLRDPDGNLVVLAQPNPAAGA